MKTFCERLTSLIETSGLTQVAFAKKAGVSPPALSNYIKGVREPTADALFKIAEAGSVSANWLRTGEGEKQDFASILREESNYVYGKKEDADPGQVLFDLQMERRKNTRLETENEKLKARLLELRISMDKLIKLTDNL